MNLSVVPVLVLLILVNALYVAAEFAAVSVRRSRIQERAEEGNWFAIRLLPYLAGSHRLDRYIATSQIGITISSLVLGAYGQTHLAPVMIPNSRILRKRIPNRIQSRSRPIDSIPRRSSTATA